MDPLCLLIHTSLHKYVWMQFSGLSVSEIPRGNIASLVCIGGLFSPNIDFDLAWLTHPHKYVHPHKFLWMQYRESNVAEVRLGNILALICKRGIFQPNIDLDRAWRIHCDD